MVEEGKNYPKTETGYLNVDTKENLEVEINKSTDSQELYDNAIKILTSMEAQFRKTLKKVGTDEEWSEEVHYAVFDTRFDEILDTNNPMTIFEKKGAELLERSKGVMDRMLVGNASIKMVEIAGEERDGVDGELKESILDELRRTREDAIQNFKDDIADGILSNANNVDFDSAIFAGASLGNDIFWNKEDMPKGEFESYVDNMNLSQLILGTFNINEGSGAFKYCYGKIKEKLGNQNLFDYIDSQRKEGDYTSELLKYVAFKSLFQRKQLIDLEGWVNGCSEGKDALLNYIKNKLKEDESFKIAFLTSMKDIEDSNVFGDVVRELEDSDESVRMARERAENIDNVDCFRDGKIDGLAIYDDEGHGGGSAFFQSELQAYRNRGFSVSPKEENSDYIKYVLKKGVDSITLVKLKMSRNLSEDFDIKNVLAGIIEGKDFNLFALRGHCYNTNEMAYALGGLDAVGEGDIVIDGGCWNAHECGRYHQLGVKGQIFAYTSEGRGASTQDFINRVISTKNSGKNFSDLLEYYDNFNGNESSPDGYFACNTQRANSIAAQYMRFVIIEDEEMEDSMGFTSNTGGVLHEERRGISVGDVPSSPADIPSSPADIGSVGGSADV